MPPRRRDRLPGGAVSRSHGPRALRTAPGTNTGAFDAGDWALTLAVATIWGSSFLWIALGLDALAPGTVAFGRLALGAAALWAYPPARRPVPRDAWPGVAVVAVAGNAGPALLFALAQQHVESSLAGMINAATPLAVLAVGVALTRRRPGRYQLAGLAVGFAGVAVLAVPGITGSGSHPAAIAMLLVAVAGYGMANNVVVPLAQRHGATAVIVRAQFAGALLLAPVGLAGTRGHSPTTGSVLAVVVLGVVGTGIARALNARLAARAGATRGSITTYLVPVVAIALGVIVRHDTIGIHEVAGTVAVVGGARLTSRPEQDAAGTAVGSAGRPP